MTVQGQYYSWERLWIQQQHDAFHSDNDGVIDSGETFELQHESFQGSQKLKKLVPVSTESRYTRPRTMYRMKTASEAGLENTIILAQTSDLLYEPILASLPKKELIETVMDKIVFFVLQRLNGLMIACGFVITENGLEFKKAVESMSGAAHALLRSAEPAQLKTVRYAKPFEEAIEDRKKKEFGLIYKYQEDDKWILSCTICGSYTCVETNSDSLCCPVCSTHCENEP
jgi:hypothetical protein